MFLKNVDNSVRLVHKLQVFIYSIEFKERSETRMQANLDAIGPQLLEKHQKAIVQWAFDIVNMSLR